MFQRVFHMQINQNFPWHQLLTHLEQAREAILPIVAVQAVLAQNMVSVKSFEVNQRYFCTRVAASINLFWIFSKSKHLGPYVPS